MNKKCMEKYAYVYRKFLHKLNINAVEAEEAELLPAG